ncbi:MAG TPA: sigma-70 family RNA polymerase sigma factor [Syntrophomonadaceae bacterium]|nr:sigma-70 family RNA polymerase sigma factor [Syntrophomonadaceae bacterium]
MAFLIISNIDNDDDRHFIEQLYEQYYPIMKKKAYEISDDYNIVDDLINEAFIKLMEKISLLRSLGCCKRTSYIVHTIRNISINHNKRHVAESRIMFLGISDDLVESIPDPKVIIEEIAAAKEDYLELGQAIQQLPERDRYLLFCKYNLDLSDREIGKILNISSNNIREYLARARRRVIKILTKRGAE